MGTLFDFNSSYSKCMTQLCCQLLLPVKKASRAIVYVMNLLPEVAEGVLAPAAAHLLLYHYVQISPAAFVLFPKHQSMSCNQSLDETQLRNR